MKKMIISSMIIFILFISSIPIKTIADENKGLFQSDDGYYFWDNYYFWDDHSYKIFGKISNLTISDNGKIVKFLANIVHISGYWPGGGWAAGYSYHRWIILKPVTLELKNASLFFGIINPDFIFGFHAPTKYSWSGLFIVMPYSRIMMSIVCLFGGIIAYLILKMGISLIRCVLDALDKSCPNNNILYN